MDRRFRALMVTSAAVALSVGLAGSVVYSQVRYSGGAAKAKRAQTQVNSTTFTEGTGWTGLPGSILQFNVPANATDVFNVAFSAECRLVGAGPGDAVLIRIVDTITVGGVFQSRGNLAPGDNMQAFCSADGFATHKGNWVLRAGPGMHNLVVQFFVRDEGNDSMEPLTASIDDWTFELVVYE
jgi:hypothetical protein